MRTRQATLIQATRWAIASFDTLVVLRGCERLAIARASVTRIIRAITVSPTAARRTGACIAQPMELSGALPEFRLTISWDTGSRRGTYSVGMSPSQMVDTTISARATPPIHTSGEGSVSLQRRAAAGAKLPELFAPTLRSAIQAQRRAAAPSSVASGRIHQTRQGSAVIWKVMYGNTQMLARVCAAQTSAIVSGASVPRPRWTMTSRGSGARAAIGRLIGSEKRKSATPSRTGAWRSVDQSPTDRYSYGVMIRAPFGGSCVAIVIQFVLSARHKFDAQPLPILRSLCDLLRINRTASAESARRAGAWKNGGPWPTP